MRNKEKRLISYRLMKRKMLFSIMVVNLRGFNVVSDYVVRHRNNILSSIRNYIDQNIYAFKNIKKVFSLKVVSRNLNCMPWRYRIEKDNFLLLNCI